VSVHQPVRPGWVCAGCGSAWPCPTRCQELAAEYVGARVSLMLYLTMCFVEACEDMPGEAAGELYRRFLYRPTAPRARRTDPSRQNVSREATEAVTIPSPITLSNRVPGIDAEPLRDPPTKYLTPPPAASYIDVFACVPDA
jgi:hypothetical protein